MQSKEGLGLTWKSQRSCPADGKEQSSQAEAQPAHVVLLSHYKVTLAAFVEFCSKAGP